MLWKKRRKKKIQKEDKQMMAEYIANAVDHAKLEPELTIRDERIITDAADHAKLDHSAIDWVTTALDKAKRERRISLSWGDMDNFHFNSGLIDAYRACIRYLERDEDDG